MRSYTFSSSAIRLSLFCLIVIGAGAALEAFCRNDRHFTTVNYFQIRHAMETDPSNAVFGDSHVLTTSQIPGFTFYGSQGQQPSELLNLVRNLYGRKPPGKIIVQADPQWFGSYHIGREALLTADNLASPYIPLLLTSDYYRSSLKTALIDAVASLIVAPFSAAKAAERSVFEITQAAEAKWGALYTKPSFNWTWLTDEERDALTIQRVYAQNPRENFQSENAARQFEEALAILTRSGAKLCLFRTPVTQRYLEMTETIPASRFQVYDTYIHGVAGRLNARYVDFHSLPLNFDDTAFLNADHMTAGGYSTMWPLAAKACFD